MNNTKKRGLIISISSMTVAFMVLTVAGLSEAQRLAPPANAVGTMRAPMVGAQPFAVKSGYISRGIGFSGANVPRMTSSLTLPHDTVTRQSEFPIPRNLKVFSGKTAHKPSLRPPSDPLLDPSDMKDILRSPANEMIDKKYLGGPDREAPTRNPEMKDYWINQYGTDWSNSSCMWTDEIWGKVSNWGGDNNPLFRDTTDGYNSWCHPEESGSQKSGDGSSKDTGGTDSGPKVSAEKPKPVSEENGKPDADRGGEEGDDPDKFRSPVVQEAIKPMIRTETSPLNTEVMNMVSQDGSVGGNAGGGPGRNLHNSKTNTPKGFPHGTEHRVGPNHENRPDVSESSLPIGLMSDPMGYAMSPGIGDDGGPVIPDPGPTASPAAGPEARSIAAAPTANSGIMMANPMSSLKSPAIGDDGGKDPNPPPGPEH